MIQAKYIFDLSWIEGKIGQDIEVVIFSVRETKKDGDGNETHTQVEKVHAKIRDLSKRFDNEYLTFNADDATFDAALRAALMTPVPGLAMVMAPLVATYNSVQTIDRIVSDCRCLFQLAQILK